MKKSFRFLTVAILAIGFFLVMVGCSKPKERFENPPWLGGSSIETLEGRGNYKIFLRLMEMANYKEPISKQLYTLFVPDDAAFTTYFQEAGIGSVEDLSKDQAVQLFTLHVLRNPRSRYQLIYEYLWAELQGPDGEYASLFFRKPTPSTSIRYKETVRYWETKKGEELTMDTGDKLVPLFTAEYFHDFNGAEDGSDYEFMFPGTTWDKKVGMAWNNAKVIEVDVDTPEGVVKKSEIKTASGFIFFIDKVVPPTPSIEEFLIANQDKYGLYYDLMQKFATYAISGRKYADKAVVYRKNYKTLSNMAEEQGPFIGNEVRMKDMFSLFLPSDAVLQEYLNNGVLQTYEHIDSVPEITLYYILQTQISRSLGLISKISKSYFNSFGDAMTITREDVNTAYMCSNGVIYDMKRVIEPNVFSCVPGYLFSDANYSTFLNCLTSSNLLATLANPLLEVTLFAPTNAQLELYNIRYNDLKAVIETRGLDGQWKTIDAVELNLTIQDHIYNGRLSDLSGSGFIEMSSENFVYYNNNEIKGAANQFIGDAAVIDETIPNDRNGILYKVSTPIKSKYVLGQFLMNNPDVSAFRDSLISTGLLVKKVDKITKDTIPTLSFLTEANYWTGFIPTNAAIAQASLDGVIPAKDKATKDADLISFLKYHFIRKNVVFDDGKVSGVLLSNRIESTSATEGTVYATLTVTNSLNNLSVEDHSGQVVTVNHADANFLVRKGVVHKINSVLKY